MRFLCALLTVSALCLIETARAQDDEILETTTALGITIKPEQVWDTVDENQSFWPPVRYFVANRLTTIDTDTRTDAVAFIKVVHEDLNDRLLGDDEAVGMDLVDYIRARLRVFEFYRQLRTVIDDDAALVELKGIWEHKLRGIHSFEVAERQSQIDGVVVGMRAEMETAGLNAETCDGAMNVWSKLGKATVLMNDTNAGRMMLTNEQKAVELERPVAELIRNVVFAAEWAQIVKSEDKLLKKADFTKAWDAVERLKQSRTARKPAGEVKQAG